MGDSNPDEFEPFPGGAFFAATTTAAGEEAYVTDGTSAGTVLLDVVPGINPSRPVSPALLGSEVLFAAQMGITNELYKTDGTIGGTVQLTGLTGATDLTPQILTTVGNRVVFMGFAPGAGFELWSSDGTTAGTQLIQDIRPGPTSANVSAFIANGSCAMFSAFDSIRGTELWCTDGTSGGTIAIDVEPGSNSSSPRFITVAGGQFFFIANRIGSGAVLHVSDGTAAGTTAVVAASAIEITPSGNRVFMNASFVNVGRELVVSDGTTAGTQAIDLTPGVTSSRFDSLTGAAGGAFFLFDDFSGAGKELWFSDGTSAGTSMVLDLVPGYASGPIPGSLTPVFGGTHVLFAANDLQTGLQLWTSDGTAAGTQRVTRFNAGGAGIARLGKVMPTGNRVFFAANDGIQGMEPWLLDGDSAFATTYGVGCASSPETPPAIAAGGGLPSLNNASFRRPVSQR